MWQAWTSSIVTWPVLLQDIVGFMSSAAFIIPLFVVMALTIYIFNSASKAKGELNVVLQDNLSLSAKDQMYLLTRLNEIEGEGGRRGANTVLPSEKTPAPAAVEGEGGYQTSE